uniref:Secreted protein n=1 Tax=Plectus sambesii TaxID=2011161 RepID=A0A914W5Z3_9BILA
MDIQISSIFVLLAVINTFLLCAGQQSVDVKNSATESGCAEQLNNFDQCMQNNYGLDDYKLDDNVDYVFNDYKDWKSCYQSSNCSAPEDFRVEVTVNNTVHKLDMDYVVSAAAACALPLLNTHVNPVLEKCVRTQIGKNSAWKVPTTSIESLSQTIEWDSYYNPKIKEGFLTPLFDAESKIREGYQRQLSQVQDQCQALSEDQWNNLQQCLIDRAHQKHYNFCTSKPKCENNVSAKCRAVRSEERLYLTECYQRIDWTTIWPKIKQPYLECIKKTPTLSFLELSSVVPFGESTMTLDINMQEFLTNATLGIAERFNESFTYPVTNIVDECSKDSTHLLGKDFNERLYDIIDIEGTDNILLIKRTPFSNTNEANTGTAEQPQDPAENKNPYEPLEPSLHRRRARAAPTCAEATKACSGAVTSQSLQDIIANKFGGI